MAKGTYSKEVIEQKILETFENSFKFDKEIRIPMIEDGNEIQIKIVMTCAKTNVEPGGDVAIPGAAKVVSTQTSAFPEPEKVKIEATEDEKAATMALMAELGL